MEVKDLTPKIVFHYFDEICQVPILSLLPKAKDWNIK